MGRSQPHGLTKLTNPGPHRFGDFTIYEGRNPDTSSEYVFTLNHGKILECGNRGERFGYEDRAVSGEIGSRVRLSGESINLPRRLARCDPR